MAQERITNVQVISSPGVGGRELDVPILACQLAALGHPTWVMCRPGTLVERLAQERGLPTIAISMQGYFNPKAILTAAQFFKKNGIQVIQSHWSRDLSNLILASWLAGGIPIVLKKHVYATEKKQDIFHQWVYQHTDLVLAVSQLVAENVVKTVPISQEKVKTLYNGIDWRNVWNPEKVPSLDLRLVFDVPAGQPILGYVGRLNQGKRPHWVIAAFQQLAGRFPDWHLVLVGKAVGASEAAYALRLQEQVHNSGLQHRIHILDYRTDMPAVMATFDLVVCASEFESLGMVLVEAMAMEKPVIGPDSGGIPEIIVPDKNGYLYASQHLDDLVNKLSWLMAHPKERRQMGKAGRIMVKQKFDLETNARQNADFLRLVVQKRAQVK